MCSLCMYSVMSMCANASCFKDIVCELNMMHTGMCANLCEQTVQCVRLFIGGKGMQGRYHWHVYFNVLCFCLTCISTTLCLVAAVCIYVLLTYGLCYRWLHSTKLC